MNRLSFPARNGDRAGLVLLPLLIIPITAAHAADAATPTVPASSFGSLLQVMFGLAVVLAAIAGTAWLLKRLGPGQASAASNLRVVGGVAVGPKERVVLVDVGDTRLVLGVSPGHITTLHQFPRPADEEAIPVEPVAHQFQARLRALLQQKEGA